MTDKLLREAIEATAKYLDDLEGNMLRNDADMYLDASEAPTLVAERLRAALAEAQQGDGLPPLTDALLSFCDASNWDGDGITGDYYRGWKDATDVLREMVVLDYLDQDSGPVGGGGGEVSGTPHAKTISAGDNASADLRSTPTAATEGPRVGLPPTEQSECPRCTEWKRLGLSDTCPDCDAIAASDGPALKCPNPDCVRGEVWYQTSPTRSWKPCPTCHGENP